MRKAVCPGSFDPPTCGHLDVIARAAALFDQVTVGVLVNENKVGLFTVEERLEMLTEAVSDHDNVMVDSFSGLLVDYCIAHEIGAIVKGVRAVSDFDYELQMAQMNRTIAGIETVLVPASPEWSFLSSSLVKEVAGLGGDVAGLVPPYVLDRLTDRLGTTPSQRQPLDTGVAES
jgi:pantetheine-phosphate adenylyltransferase